MVVYPIIFRVFYIPGGAGFQPSTVWKLQQKKPSKDAHHLLIHKSFFVDEYPIPRDPGSSSENGAPPKFNSSPLKIGGWKTTFLSGR